MAGKARDPRSEAEKARADLMRNDAMGMAVPESPLELQPSVTPETFGETGEHARVRSGGDEGVEAGGVAPAEVAAEEPDPLGSPAEAEQVAVGPDRTAPLRPEGEDEDVLSRAKE
jgi:hypothetical protein